MTRSPCCHCRRFVSQPGRRGLCYRCYNDPAVRAVMPLAESPFNKHGVGIGNVRQLPLPEPTTATPGSPEKVAVLEQRAASGQALWHPADGN